MKFAAYMAWIHLFKTCNFTNQVYYNYGDNEFVLRDCFYWRILHYNANVCTWHCSPYYDRVSMGRNAIATVRPSVRPSVRLFQL